MGDDVRTDGELDLTAERIKSNGEAVIHVQEYDPRPQEDSARRRIAYILLALLCIILFWALASVVLRPESKADVVEILQIILGPIIALVSAATGFYFGSKT